MDCRRGICMKEINWTHGCLCQICISKATKAGFVQHHIRHNFPRRIGKGQNYIRLDIYTLKHTLWHHSYIWKPFLHSISLWKKRSQLTADLLYLRRITHCNLSSKGLYVKDLYVLRKPSIFLSIHLLTTVGEIIFIPQWISRNADRNSFGKRKP